jgi:hypothetical protein
MGKSHNYNTTKRWLGQIAKVVSLLETVLKLAAKIKDLWS